MTQTDISDALGLTNAHINRMLQQLRNKGIITLRRTVLVVNNWKQLKKVGEFVPNHLHLNAV